MLWVKLGDHVYQSIGHNTFDNKQSGKWELWITRPTGKSTPVLEGTKEEVEEMFGMFNFSLQKRIPFIEVR